jgi:tRNA pseudouridine38-40 synthase
MSVDSEDSSIYAATQEAWSQPPRDPRLQRYKLTLAYDGLAFHGWQKQEPPPPAPPLRTVAGVVEDRLRRVLQQPIVLTGASRTDAGVHARGQVAHFDALPLIPLERMAAAINARLPADLEVLSVEAVAPEFNAVSGARCKQYRYRIHNQVHRPLEKRHHVWHCWLELDVARMHDAAARLVGEHDFASFAAAGHQRASTVRTIFVCGVKHDAVGGEVHIVVQGNGFLYNMVRIIAGTLVEVGRGRWSAEDVARIVSACDRAAAGPTLPPTGLWLEWIRYD